MSTHVEDHARILDMYLDKVRDERIEQIKKWGDQHHQYRNEEQHNWLFLEQAWKQTNADRVRHHELCWDGVLLEEVGEALAAGSKSGRISELVQVAAVALAMIEDLVVGVPDEAVDMGH